LEQVSQRDVHLNNLRSFGPVLWGG